jgi:transposase
LWIWIGNEIAAVQSELLKLWVNGGFNGQWFAAWVQTQHPKLGVEVVKRRADVPGFTLPPKRWVVERPFGWRMHCRRRVRDHEQTVASATTWIYLAMLRFMLRRRA